MPFGGKKYVTNIVTGKAVQWASCLLYLLNGFQESLSICDFVRNPGQNPFQRGGLLIQLLERLLSAAGTVLVT